MQARRISPGALKFLLHPYGSIFYCLKSDRQIAGLNVNRAMVGQDSDDKPFTPVSYKEQKAAMNALASYGFAPNAFEKAEALYPYLQQQRRGFFAIAEKIRKFMSVF